MRLKCGAVNTPAGIGLEPTLGEWVANVVAVMREVRRVLRDDGTVWLNLGTLMLGAVKGNELAKNGNHNAIALGLRRQRTAGHRCYRQWRADDDHAFPPRTSLLGQPWRVAFALQDDGWILRSAIVWHKPNPMPESVQRTGPRRRYEMVFLLAKQGRYFYDAWRR